MAITTYAELQTAIANWLDDSGLTSRIPEFIALAEASINRIVRTREMQTRATATASTSSRYLATPAGFVDMARLEITSDPLHKIKYISNHQIADYYKTSSGKPLYFSVWSDELEFNQVFDSAYTLDMKYYKAVTALSGSNTSNDILTYHPDIYLYGSLVAASPYVAEDNRTTVWMSEYNRAVTEANDFAKKSQRGGSELKIRSKGLRP